MTPARDLRPFFAPRSVAVVGAGDRPTSSGGVVLQNLRISRFGGAVHPVNPKGGTPVDAGPVIARPAAVARGATLPVMHSMMGTLTDRAAWFATMEEAGVPMFDDVEAMVARDPALRTAAIGPADLAGAA